MAIARRLLLAASQNRWLANRLPRYPFARRAVRRFMPGETSADALRECAALQTVGITSVITRLGENITQLDDASDVTRHYLAVLKEIEQAGLPTHVSVKPTQLGFDIDPAAALHSVQALMRAARSEPIWIDMESSRYTQGTVDLFHNARAGNENVGLCVQAYLRRTQSDLTTLLQSTTAIRLVKGAYQEPDNLAFPRKSDVDANYLDCAAKLLERAKQNVVGHVPAFATHDVAIIRQITRMADGQGLGRDQYEFQLLYGINGGEQRRLARDGYRVRVLISYGEAWFAWYMRRLAERPANVLFLLKNVF